MFQNEDMKLLTVSRQANIVNSLIRFLMLLMSIHKIRRLHLFTFKYEKLIKKLILTKLQQNNRLVSARSKLSFGENWNATIFSYEKN